MESRELRIWKKRKSLVKEYDDQYYESTDRKVLIKRLKELESENLRLEQKVWRSQYGGSIPIGLALAITGGISLLLSYVYSSLILTFIGLGLTLWGALIFYVSPSRYVPEEIVNSIPLSMIKSLDTLLACLGYKGRTIFLHPRYMKGLTQGYVFIPYDDVFKIPTPEQISEEKVFYENPKGILMTAPSQGLVDLFEKEMHVNFAAVDMVHIREHLPRILIEDLKIVDDVSIETKDGIVDLKVVGESCAKICDSITKQTHLGSHLGCPLCSAIALVFSKVSGKGVAIKESIVKNHSIETTYMILDF